jgi:hypothetical protein
MSDTVDIKIDWEFVLLNEEQTLAKFWHAFNDFPMTLQVDSTTWDEMSSDDRDEVIVNDLWERCRTNVIKIKE